MRRRASPSPSSCTRKRPALTTCRSAARWITTGWTRCRRSSAATALRRLKRCSSRASTSTTSRLFCASRPTSPFSLSGASWRHRRAAATTRRISAEALFGSLFEQSAVGIAVFSLGGRFLRANAAMCRMLGYSEHDLLQKTHLDVMHLDDLEAAAMSRAQVISGKAKPRTQERRYLHKVGSTVWAHVAGAVVRDGAGAPLCTVAIVNDVSSLRRAIKTSEQRFRRMVDMSSDWYWMQDENFHFVDVPGLDMPELDTDVVVGRARWEIPGLAALPEKAWEQHRGRLERHESFSDFVFLRYNRSG